MALRLTASQTSQQKPHHFDPTARDPLVPCSSGIAYLLKNCGTAQAVRSQIDRDKVPDLSRDVTLMERGVADMMVAVFDSPMATSETQQVFRGGSIRG